MSEPAPFTPRPRAARRHAPSFDADNFLRELDVIARAPDPNSTIVFIEVKTRTTLDFGIAEAVTPRKLHRMHRAAYRWLTERHVPWSEVRFDVVAIYLDPTGLASVQRYIGVDDGAR